MSLLKKIEYLLRTTVCYPRQFPIVSLDEGDPVGEILETASFPPNSSVRGQAEDLIRNTLTDIVLLGNLDANAFHFLGFKWKEDGSQIARFQPVKVSSKSKVSEPKHAGE